MAASLGGPERGQALGKQLFGAFVPPRSNVGGHDRACNQTSKHFLIFFFFFLNNGVSDS